MMPFDPRLQLIAAQARVKTCHVYHCWQAMRVMGKGFHAAAFAQFAGLEERHVMSILSALGDHDALPEGRAKVERRATRLADDWTIPDEWLDWAIEKRRWHPDDVRAEADIFAGYWQAKSGQQASKVDWFKTWQNWVRQSRREDGIYRQTSNGPQLSREERLRGRAELYERMGRTTEAEEIRRILASQTNVLPFHRIDSENESQAAVLGR